MRESEGPSISKDLVAASATPLVLSLLQGEESYGYAIIQKVKELSGNRLQWTDGMLYPVLHRLERNGLVAARWRDAGSRGKPAETGRRRKYYRITEEGLAELETHKRQWEIVDSTLRKAWTDISAIFFAILTLGRTVPCSI